MKLSPFLSSLVLATIYVKTTFAESTWETLTPTATWSGGLTDYTTTFGIAVVTIDSSSSASTSGVNEKRKRDLISQIDDGQIQATTVTSSSSSSTTTLSSTADVISQISDGQIQATTATSTSTSSTETSSTTADVISQISDGQIQATTATSTSTSSTETSSTTDVISQISDGQIQATSSGLATTLTTSYISSTDDSSTSASSTTISTTSSDSDSDSDSDSSDYVTLESCKTSSSLAMILQDSILTDAKGRIGSIVANHQFQFDGPPPQAGAIYAKGWSITQEGYLAIGDNDLFYQCLSGTFYNLYDEHIGSECYPIHLEAVNLIDCD